MSDTALSCSVITQFDHICGACDVSGMIESQKAIVANSVEDGFTVSQSAYIGRSLPGCDCPYYLMRVSSQSCSIPLKITCSDSAVFQLSLTAQWLYFFRV